MTHHELTTRHFSVLLVKLLDGVVLNTNKFPLVVIEVLDSFLAVFSFGRIERSYQLIASERFDVRSIALNRLVYSSSDKCSIGQSNLCANEVLTSLRHDYLRV